MRPDAGHQQKAVGIMSASSQTRQVNTPRRTGWASFAAVILLLNGLFSATQGLVLLIGPESYRSVDVNGEFVLFDLTGWGWWNLILGVLLIVAAAWLSVGGAFGRIVAVIVAVISAVFQVVLLPVQPFWSLVIIAVDVLVIYAVVVHGDELRKRSSSR